MFEALINVVETYGETFDKPLLVLCQLATNGVVSGAEGDVLRVDNTAQIAASNATVAESTKAAIFLDGENV